MHTCTPHPNATPVLLEQNAQILIQSGIGALPVVKQLNVRRFSTYSKTEMTEMNLQTQNESEEAPGT